MEISFKFKLDNICQRTGNSYNDPELEQKKEKVGIYCKNVPDIQVFIITLKKVIIQLLI